MNRSKMIYFLFIVGKRRKSC